MKRIVPCLILAACLLAFGLVVGRLVAPGPNPAPVPPGPAPGPVDPPTPPAPGAPAGVVVVEDPADAGQARGLFLADKRVQAFFRNSALSHAIYSATAAGPDGLPVGGRPAALIAAAKAKTLPYLFVLDAAGGVLKEQAFDLDADKFLALFDGHGPRAMGCKNEAPRLQWAEFGSAAAPATKLIPRDRWRPVDLEAYAGPVHDQDGRGQCNASMACTMLEMAREVGGMGYAHLSGGDLYSRINGGRDAGSTLEDGMAALRDEGVATAKTVPYVWNGRVANAAAVKAERKSYRARDVFLCPSFDHVASAVQQGFPTGIGVKWYDNFRPDKDGWLPYRGSGGSGGHAITVVGLDKRVMPNGSVIWAVKIRNSWGPAWGLGGNCYVPESLFDGWIGGFYAIGSAVRTPEPFPPSEPARRARLTLDPAEMLQLAP